MSRVDKKELAVMECYRRMYAVATPPADFDEMIRTAKINENGQKVIPFNSHEITEKDFYDIVNDVCKEYKLRGWQKDVVRNTVTLGCSPKFKK